MSKQDQQLQLKGTVHASHYDDAADGKLFLGAIVEFSDGSRWVVDYSELSPFHVFANRRVLVYGDSYAPDGQHLIGVRHLRVSTMRLVDLTLEDRFVEIEAEQHIAGQFELDNRNAGESSMLFVTEKGSSFQVANDPPGARVGRWVEVSAYAMKTSASAWGPMEPYPWIICPHSMEDFWEWRKRSKGVSH